MFSRRPRWAALAALSTAVLAAVPLGACSAAGALDLAPPNVPFPTLGGRQLWSDVRWRSGWRVQRHAWTGHHRLLDDAGVRRAWGGLDHCEEALARRAPEVADGTHLVLLLHGFGRSRSSLAGLERSLEERGFTTVRTSSPTLQTGMGGQVANLEALLNHLPPQVERVSFVTHSLGGRIAGEILEREGAGWRSRIEVGGLVMLAPPNRGSSLARRVTGVPVLGLLAPQTLRELAVPRDAPIAAAPTAVIAARRGSRFGWNPLVPGDDDGVVSVWETDVVGAQSLHVRASHTFLMDHRAVAPAVERFLREGAL